MSIKLSGVDSLTTINLEAEGIGTYHLALNANLYEPQRTNNFEFVATGLDTLIRAGALGNEARARFGEAGYVQEILRISNVTAPIPHFQLGVLSVKRGNNEIKFAGVPTFSAGSVVYNNWIGAEVSDILTAWQNIAYNVRTEKIGLASDYKKQCYLIDYTPDHLMVRKFILEGCWVSNIQETERSNEDNSICKITCEIQYDKAYIDTTGLV